MDTAFFFTSWPSWQKFPYLESRDGLGPADFKYLSEHRFPKLEKLKLDDSISHAWNAVCLDGNWVFL